MKHKWVLAALLALCWLAVLAEDNRPQRAAGAGGGGGAGGRGNKEGVLRLRLQDGFFEDDDDDGTGEVIRIVQAPDLSGGPLNHEDIDEAAEEHGVTANSEEPEDPPRELTPEEARGASKILYMIGYVFTISAEIKGWSRTIHA